jgi:phosphatidylserine/phosphatidylglycerophosphate/cardiolipin synthase-like enzyme
MSAILTGLKRARKSIAMTIFRLDRPEIEQALGAAVARGVTVRALIAHTNANGEKALRRLELRLLDAGVTVARTGDDLIRYHNKMIVVDAAQLFVLGFNFTRLDMDQSRSFGVITRNRALVADALKLFDADASRQPYSSGNTSLIVSPENARERLASFIRGARRQLLVYDPKLSDPVMIRLILDRAKAGVDVRILGRIGRKGAAVAVQPLSKMRLHVRAMMRDGAAAFVGSQSLRKLELDARREVGVLTRDPRAVKRLTEVFEADWANTPLAREGAAQVEKELKRAARAEETGEVAVPV